MVVCSETQHEVAKVINEKLQQPQSTHRAFAGPRWWVVIKPHSSTTFFFFQNPLKQKSPYQTKSLFELQQNWLGKWKQCRDHRTQLSSLFLCPLWSSWERRVREGEGEKPALIHQEHIQQQFFHLSELCCNTIDIWHFVWNESVD